MLTLAKLIKIKVPLHQFSNLTFKLYYMCLLANCDRRNIESCIRYVRNIHVTIRVRTALGPLGACYCLLQQLLTKQCKPFKPEITINIIIIIIIVIIIIIIIIITETAMATTTTTITITIIAKINLLAEDSSLQNQIHNLVPSVLFPGFGGGGQGGQIELASCCESF